MQFVLITSTGDRLYFYIEECAEIYKSIHGGEIFNIDTRTNQIIWKDVNKMVKYG
jgi:hypothetical protein